MRPSRPLVFSFAVLIALVAGCRDNSVKAYRVPKEKEPEAPAATAAAGDTNAPPPGMAGTPVATAGGAGLTWAAPSGWESRQGSAMRKATYAITGEGGATAELAVTAFPGDVGGDLANVNRWRGQIGLPPISAAELPAALERFEANGLKIAVADLTASSGTPPTRVLGGIVPHDGSTWFFKLTGPAPLLEREKAAFIDFLKTVKAP
ncbi:MAG TPA: hypothetical protein VGD81_11100 [Opitutaceae bacterium]